MGTGRRVGGKKLAHSRLDGWGPELLRSMSEALHEACGSPHCVCMYGWRIINRFGRGGPFSQTIRAKKLKKIYVVGNGP